MGASLIIILLTAPITWTTNLVWLAPIVPLILFGPDLPNGRRAAAAAAVIGCVLLIIPDPLIHAAAHGRLGALLGAHYVLALILLLPYTLCVAVRPELPSAASAPANERPDARAQPQQ
jgi:hypothetical protein